MGFPRATALAHEWVGASVRPGDTVVDATVGNGHDTLFLARLVGDGGRVIGFDRQAEAIASAKERLREHGQVEWHHMSHALLGEVVAGPVAAVMFNLGYLPSGDKSVITRPESTLPALEAATRLLAVGGVLTIVAYPGHDGGSEEADAVESWAAGLDSEVFQVARYELLNRNVQPPRLIGVRCVGRATV